MKAICIMYWYLQASKDLDEPAHTCSLIDASAFPSVFTLYLILVWDVFLLYLSRCFLVLNQNKYAVWSSDLKYIKEYSICNLSSNRQVISECMRQSK